MDNLFASNLRGIVQIKVDVEKAVKENNPDLIVGDYVVVSIVDKNNELTSIAEIRCYMSSDGKIVRMYER